MMSRSTLKILLPIAVLIAGAGATAALISSRQAPERVERPALGPLVETVRVEAADVRLTVDGQGEVSPRVQVDVAPEVTGRLVKVHSAMVVGGRFRAGTPLLHIDPRDYELAVERARAAVATAETIIEREQAESDAALVEWREVHDEEPAPPLLVRAPQMREARARMAAAQADLSGAELALARTRVSLPFDGVVIEENVDVGQRVASGQKVATVYGTDAVEIRVPLDDRELAWFDLPQGKVARGPRAEVSADFAGERHTWEGRVERLEGQVDPRSRMVRVVVVVDEPFAQEGRPPLLPGTFVDVSIVGRELGDVVTLPRHALREGDQVWVVSDDTLEIRDVDIWRQDRSQAYLRAGLESGETVVVSSLDAVTDGMTVRVEAGGDSDG